MRVQPLHAITRYSNFGRELLVASLSVKHLRHFLEGRPFTVSGSTNLEELGDRQPSQFLRHMKTLLGGRAEYFDAGILRELFLQRLPPAVQMILATAEDFSLPELAVYADKIMEVIAHHPGVSSAMCSPGQQQEPTPGFPGYPPPFQLVPQIVELRRALYDLAVLVENKLAPSRSTFRDQQPRPYRRSPSRFHRSPAQSPSQHRNSSPSRVSYHPPMC